MTDLPTALRALTDDQPLQPADRVAAVTGRARRVRRNRRLVAGLAAVALLVPAGALTLGGGGDDNLQPAATSVLTWPDRSTAADRGVAQGAIEEHWNTGLYGAEPPRDIRWLYRAPVRLPDGSVKYVAVFTATDTDLGGQPRRSLFAATADRPAVDDEGVDRDRPDDVSSSPWVVRRVDAAIAADPLGLYLAYGDHRNLLLLLADPDASAMSWQATRLPGAALTEDASGRGHSTNGVFLVDVGTLSGPVEVDLGHGSVRVEGPLGAPTLRPPDAPDLPAGWRSLSGGTGQSQETGRWPVEGVALTDLNGVPRVPLTVIARCYGGGELAFTLYPLQTTGPISAEGDADITVSSETAPPAARGRVPCDGRSHRAFAPVSLRTGGLELRLTHDRPQSYAYAVASRH